MEVWIEFLVQWLEFLNSVLLQHLQKFALGELDAVEQSLGSAISLFPQVRVERAERALHIVCDRENIACEGGDAVLASIRHLALGPLAQIFHFRERAQQFVLVIGGFAGEHGHGVLFCRWHLASRGIDRRLGRGLAGFSIVLIGRGARCANGPIRHCLVPTYNSVSSPISGLRPQKSSRNGSLQRHHPPISLVTTLAV